MTKMTRTQIQKMLNKLDGKSERTALAISEFEGGVRALQEKLQQEISVSTLEEVNLKINQLRKSINLNPLLDATKTLQDEFKANALATLDEIEKKVKSLRIELTSIINEGNKATKETTDIIAKNVATVNEKIEKVSGETSEQIKQVIGTIETVSSKLPSFADKKEGNLLETVSIVPITCFICSDVSPETFSIFSFTVATFLAMISVVSLVALFPSFMILVSSMRSDLTFFSISSKVAKALALNSSWRVLVASSKGFKFILLRSWFILRFTSSKVETEISCCNFSCKALTPPSNSEIAKAVRSLLPSNLFSIFCIWVLVIFVI